jgi:restriction system protein
MLFSTSEFQEGAVEYAIQHGIALVRLAYGETSYFARSANPAPVPDSVPSYVGWLIARHDGASDGVSHSLVASGHPDALNKFLFDSSAS